MAERRSLSTDDGKMPPAKRSRTLHTPESLLLATPITTTDTVKVIGPDPAGGNEHELTQFIFGRRVRPPVALIDICRILDWRRYLQSQLQDDDVADQLEVLLRLKGVRWPCPHWRNDLLASKVRFELDRCMARLGWHGSNLERCKKDPTERVLTYARGRRACPISRLPKWLPDVVVANSKDNIVRVLEDLRIAGHEAKPTMTTTAALVEGDDTPTKEGGTPATEERPHAKEDGTPVEEDNTPAEKDGTLIQESDPAHLRIRTGSGLFQRD